MSNAARAFNVVSWILLQWAAFEVVVIGLAFWLLKGRARFVVSAIAIGLFFVWILVLWIIGTFVYPSEKYMH